LAAAAFAYARAKLRSGDRPGAAAVFREAVEVDDDLAASLPPALRRLRESGPAAALFRALHEEIEGHAATGADRPGHEPAAGYEGDMDQERLLKLLEINKQLNQAQDMRALLDTIMDVATQTTGAERGFLILVDDGKISFQMLVGPSDNPDVHAAITGGTGTYLNAGGELIHHTRANGDEEFIFNFSPH